MLPLKDENPTVRRPWVTLAIITACLGVYFLWQPTPWSNTTEDARFDVAHAAIPCEVAHGRPLTEAELQATYGNQIPRVDACGIDDGRTGAALPHKHVWVSVLVSLFLHGSVVHVLGNLLFLWIFGNNIEDRLGRIRFLGFYLVGGVIATLGHVYLDVSSTVPMVGASGAIAAVMGAYLVWFPDAPVRTLVFLGIPWIVRIKARWVLGFWFVLQFFTSPNSGVAWGAHVTGFAFGALVAALVRWVRPVRRVALMRDHRDGPWDPTGGLDYDWATR